MVPNIVIVVFSSSLKNLIFHFLELVPMPSPQSFTFGHPVTVNTITYSPIFYGIHPEPPDDASFIIPICIALTYKIIRRVESWKRKKASMSKHTFQTPSEVFTTMETRGESSKTAQVDNPRLDSLDVDESTPALDPDQRETASDSSSDLSAGLTGSPPRFRPYMDNIRLENLRNKKPTRNAPKPLPWWDIRRYSSKHGYQRLYDLEEDGASDSGSDGLQTIWIPVNWEERINQVLPPLLPRKEDEYRASVSNRGWRVFKRRCLGDHDSTPSDQGIPGDNRHTPEENPDWKQLAFLGLSTTSPILLIVVFIWIVWTYEEVQGETKGGPSNAIATSA